MGLQSFIPIEPSIFWRHLEVIIHDQISRVWKEECIRENWKVLRMETHSSVQCKGFFLVAVVPALPPSPGDAKFHDCDHGWAWGVQERRTC